MRIADELVIVSACVLLVMAMVGWVGAGMEVLDGMHVGQSQGCWLHEGDVLWLLQSAR